MPDEAPARDREFERTKKKKPSFVQRTSEGEVGMTGFEPATTRTPCVYSTRLNYIPGRALKNGPVDHFGEEPPCSAIAATRRRRPVGGLRGIYAQRHSLKETQLTFLSACKYKIFLLFPLKPLWKITRVFF